MTQPQKGGTGLHPHRSAPLLVRSIRCSRVEKLYHQVPVWFSCLKLILHRMTGIRVRGPRKFSVKGRMQLLLPRARTTPAHSEKFVWKTTEKLEFGGAADTTAAV